MATISRQTHHTRVNARPEEENDMQTLSQEGHALVWRNQNEIMRIEPWGPDSFRVRAAIGGKIHDDLPNALLEPASVTPEIEMKTWAAVMHNGGIKAEFSKFGGLAFFGTTSGAELLAELPGTLANPTLREFRYIGGGLSRVEARFKSYEEERIYGLGQHQHGRLDQKGCVIDLLQRNMDVCIPFLLSSRGYGFLWNNPAVGRVELGRNHTRWVAEATRQIDYWITAGSTPAEILEHYAAATGHPLMLPEWAAGFWQSRLRYETQDELLEIAKEYKRRNLPLSVIVIDGLHWTMQGDWRFDAKCWPDPAAMVRELDKMGVKVVVSVWPTVNPRSVNFAKMREMGFLVQNVRGVEAHMPFVDINCEGTVYVHFYDPTNPDARKFVWEQTREGYYRYGIKAWWLDACEPEMHPLDPDNLRFHAGDGAAVLNLYPMMHARAFHDGMRAEGETEIISLCRSAWAGSQRYGAAVWSGDIPSIFESLQAQVRAGLNIGLSGIPWWTTDIGGCFGGDLASPYFRELVVRWFQFGAFCPLCRLHGLRWQQPEGRFWEIADLMRPEYWKIPNEVWSFGDEAYGIIREYLLLRERLRPYIMRQMRLAHEKGAPPMRPLFFDFPDDQGSAAIEDQFMFGPDLLVAPVLHLGARSREVYLPAPTSWTDAWTGKVLKGGQRIVADAPMETIPLYVREGVELPIRPPKS